MSLIDYQDPVTAWDDPQQFALGPVFTPVDLGNTAAPNDTLGSNLSKGIESLGQKTVDFFTTTADLFGKGLGYVLQGKQAYDIITAPKNQAPQTTVAQSQLPSLQGQQSTDPLTQSMTNLRNILSKIITPSQSDQVTNVGPYTLPPLVVIGGIIFLLVLIARHK